MASEEKNKRNWLLIGLATLLLAGTVTTITYWNILQAQRSELMLSRYPRDFKDDTLVVIGEDASPAEHEAAKAVIENLGKLGGSIPAIKSDTSVTAAEREKHNFILIGIKESNGMLNEVWEKGKAEAVTENIPGAGRGIIEIIPNPWNNERIILVIAGSDEGGVRAGKEVLKYVKELDKKSSIVVTWDNLEENRQATALGLTLGEFHILDQEVRAHFESYFPGEFGRRNYPIVYRRQENAEKKPGLIVIKATARAISPSPSAVFGFQSGKVFLISEIE